MSGLEIKEGKIITDNGEEYTLEELRYLRWQFHQYRRLSEVLSRDLKRSGREDSVVFALPEVRQIRNVLRLLNDKLPGYKLKSEVA